MVDLRKLFNELRDACEEDINYPPKGTDLITATELNEKILDALTKMDEGLDEVESEVKKLVASVETLREEIEEIGNSLY